MVKFIESLIKEKKEKDKIKRLFSLAKNQIKEEKFEESSSTYKKVYALYFAYCSRFKDSELDRQFISMIKAFLPPIEKGKFDLPKEVLEKITSYK